MASGHVGRVRRPGASARLSLAYTNTDGPAAPLIEALSSVPKISADALITSCQLIILNRDEGMYVWEPYATVELGS
ncbi:hypothetical protein [Micromonospora humi]|uniref:Uncharacterized protein n=1 Tax=Micromonospora humi TaxID=745366 RepID=A0A1C5I449_9ACTN|nr:hypothetical protein [Micromonospora humi]SCG53110.1 hypothetical protein GA0070213_104430 [Micromonospora humi]